MKGFWRDKQVLVTGATGFLGGWLVEELYNQEAQVITIVRDSRPDCRFYRDSLDQGAVVVAGDLKDAELVKRVVGDYEIDTIFHLGAQTIVRIGEMSPVETFQSNITGTWNILDAAKAGRVRRTVIASSDKAYGNIDPPYIEDMPLAGVNPYDVSKSCGDLIANSYHQTYGTPVSIVRCSNLYGGGDLNWNRIIPGTIRSVLRGENPVIRGDGLMKRDYMYVKDAVRAYLAVGASEKANGQAFNFGTETPTTVLEVVSKILDVMGSHSAPEVQAKPSKEIKAQWLSIAKARSMLSWKPEWTLQSGLEDTVSWYRSYLSRGL